MANVSFKKGSQASYDKLKSYTAGAFYLTEDTNRLYFSKDGSTAEILNRYIQQYNSFRELPLKGTEGDFYYAKQENVLCRWNGDGWAQINPDTAVTNNADSVSASGNTATITNTITSNRGPVKTTSHKITAGTALNVSGSNDTVTLNHADVSHTNTSGESAEGNTFTIVDSVTVNAQGHVTNVRTHTQTVPAPEIPEIPNITVNGGEVNPSQYVTGISASGHTLQVSRGNLDKKIQDALNALNPMTYKGTVGAGGTVSALPIKPAIGDTYMVCAPGSYGDQSNAKIGDLFIATGNEVDGVITSELKWTYVPSGDDSYTDNDTTYELSGETADQGYNFVLTASDRSTDQVSVKSTSLAIGGSANNMTINLEWGSF